MSQLRWTATRDILLFFVGVAGVAHEVLLTNTERPTLLILFAAMMGLPAVLRQDGGGLIGKKEIAPPQEKPKQVESPKDPGEQ